MAPPLALALLLATLLAALRPAAAVTARVELDLHNLSLALLSEARELELSEAFAGEIAAALLADRGSVADLQGVPGRVSLGAPAATTVAPAKTTDPLVTASPGLPPLSPLRGVAYRALPCRNMQCDGHGLPSEDLGQAGYAAQWGRDGRDDLGVIQRLGGNAVRLYHAIGDNMTEDHGAFLDRAEELGLNVLPGYHTELAGRPSECPGFDCFEAWRRVTRAAFRAGFARNGSWHPAVAALVLLDEPDHLEAREACSPAGPWCRVKAALSALDGVLAAEREAGVEPGRVRLTVTWSFAIRESIDGRVEAAGLFGFQDMVAAIAEPALANYTPRLPQAEFQRAFAERWVHGLNTNAPWDFVHRIVSEGYVYSPTPWFIGAYGASELPRRDIQDDLESMELHAQGHGAFLGAVLSEFQTAYHRGGSELNFGLFSLGEELVARTGMVCDPAHPCKTWPVHCLSTDLEEWLPGSTGQRAQAVAAAWGGEISGDGLCAAPPARLLSEGPEAALTTVACYVYKPETVGIASVAGALAQARLAERLVNRTVEVLGADSAAVVGSLAAGALVAEDAGDSAPRLAGSEADEHRLVRHGWTFVAGLLLGLAVGTAAASAAMYALQRRRAHQWTRGATTPSNAACSYV